MRVDGASPRGFLRFLSLTGPLAPRVAVAADAASFIKKGRGWRRGLCRRVVKEKVLRIDRPAGRRVLKFDGAFGPEGCGIALSGDEHEVSVTDSTFCVIWHNKHYDDQPPPVAFPPLVPYGTTFPPLSGGTIKIRKAILS